MSTLRIPVVSRSGKALTPCTPAKARKLISGGVAEKKWSRLGIFYIRMLVETREYTPELCLGLDPGSKFDGVAVVSGEEVLLTGMLELPKGVTKRMKQRSRQRRFRRCRKCRRRPCRFSNRGSLEGWIAPSQKAKVDFRLKVVEELKDIYPISKAVVEDVRFNHYKKRWGKYFSTVEIGKTKVYKTLALWFNILKLVSGVDTLKLRDRYHAEKCSDKRKRVVESHAIDALVLAAGEVGLNELVVPSFIVWKRHQYPRRQLHKFQFARGGRRRREGGSTSLNGFRKGDIVIWKDGLARVGGYMNGLISLHSFDVDNKRFTQRANPNDCIRLFNQKIMYSAIPPTSKECGLPCEVFL